VSVAPPAVRFSGITKRFPGITALSGVSVDVAAGSCHAICGENGAGKSTLGRVLAGILEPDEGHVELDGVPRQFSSPSDAMAAGVAMVHQELALCENLTVAENLSLGHLPRSRAFVDRPALRRRARALLEEVHADIDPDRPTSSLSIAEQQLCQIAGAVGEGARVIVFDEPTSSLGGAETESFYWLVESLRARGVTMLFVSHRLGEIFRVADTITVLRDGEHTGTWPVSAIDEPALIQQMIGRRLEQYFPDHTAQALGEERLGVERLSSPGHFEDVTFTVRAGEVVGLAGLVGAGRSEIAAAIFGLDERATGTIHVGGEPVRLRHPRDAMRAGIGLVPEDRKRQGLVLSMCAGENVTLPILSRLARLGWIDREESSATVATYFDRLRVKAAPSDAAVALSGGTQQKLVMAKWLAADCDILLLDEPTRGVDVGTKAELHAWIDRLAAAGTAVLLISSELPELIALSTRILVMRGGQIVGEVSRADASQDGLLRMMAGL
jgi:ABC-type sugar transport system ATPase subunit